MRRLKFPASSHIGLASAERKTAILFRHHVSAILVLDAQFRRLTQFQIKAFRSVCIRRYAVSVHLPVTSALTYLSPMK